MPSSSSHPPERLVNRVDEADFVSPTRTGLDGQPDEYSACRLISAELSDSSTLSVGWARILPGQTHLRHYHPTSDEFYVIIHGTSVVTLDDHQYPARPGESYFMPAGTIHGIFNPGDEPCEFLYGFDAPSLGSIGTVFVE